MRRVQTFTRSLFKRLYTTSNRTQRENPESLKYIIATLVAGSATLCLANKLKQSELACDVKTVLAESSKEDDTPSNKSSPTLTCAINESRDLIQRKKDECGCPGMVVAVSIDGRQVWAEGFGFSDVENRVLCHPGTVMRIASISKPMAMTAVAKAWEDGKLDLDKPIQEYVPYFPEKTFEGEKVTLTTRQLVSHLGGIRHYEKTLKEDNKNSKDSNTDKANDNRSKKANEKNSKPIEEKAEQKKKVSSQFDNKEYYIKEHYDTVEDAVKIFKDDPLLVKPESKFLYTTHGWTLISAVLEGAVKKSFTEQLKTVLNDLGMSHTNLDEAEPLIYHRARYYHKDKKGRLANVPYVDCSYKWAGGGLVSDVSDLLKFANAILYSYQVDDVIKQNTVDQSKDNQTPSRNKLLPGYLKSETVKKMWTPVVNTSNSSEGGNYGMGWGIRKESSEYGYGKYHQFYAAHTGGAVGASSALLVLPSRQGASCTSSTEPPRGVAVAILTNMQSVGMLKTAAEIAEKFQTVRESN
ncbi:unnamed protein product [Owenia fusiformis]|uniref:Uncharacterized protein n=1 Tax=Owenia fusiformis TaxID=6347 RepID=A0A8J1UIA7_OWEFU|nr:unnamed protein product [Owenia fusiformis]